MPSNVTRAVPAVPRPAGLPAMEIIEDQGAIAERYSAYLADESRSQGRAEIIAFPRCEADVARALELARSRKLAVTVSSGRTGICAGAVPDGGMLMSMERMDSLAIEDASGRKVARCGPGVTLKNLSAELGKCRPALFLPPNPTETTAQVGGAVAANASGSRSYRWGAMRRYVVALRVVLAGGDVLALRRGECLEAGGEFVIERAAGAAAMHVPAPGYVMPKIKNASGYWSAPGMDIIDLFIGSEGTLGVVTEVTFAPEPLPESIATIQGFFPAEANALAFVAAVRKWAPGAGAVEAIEYFDGGSLALLAEKRAADGPGSEVPETPAGAGAAVLVEVSGAEDETMSALERLGEMLAANGADPDAAWVGTDHRERERLAAFRHALPESVNALIGRARTKHPGLTKVGTDMAVPDGKLEEMLAAYRRSLETAGLRYVIFGHIGDNHLHANVLPQNMEEYARAKALYLELAGLAVRLGGTVSAEHGIGKLKKKFLELMYGPEGIAAMRRARQALDPDGLFGRGSLFE